MRFNGRAAAAFLADRGISISAAARATGVERSHLSNVLAGRRSAGADLVKKFAELCQVEPMALVGPEDAKAAVAELARMYELTADDLKGAA